MFPVVSDRSIYLNKSIDLDLYNSVFPKICELRETSGEPIYIYIDSRGGIVSYAEKLHELLRAPRHDGSSCQIVTIVPQLAASAAADLAILGDYSTIYPSGIIHCHGTRVATSELTVDNLIDYDITLRSENEYHAFKLARKVCKRLAVLTWIYKQDITDYLEELDKLEKNADYAISDYFSYLADKQESKNRLSPSGLKFLNRCQSRWHKKSSIISVIAPESGANSVDIAQNIFSTVIEQINTETTFTDILRQSLDDAILLSEAFGGEKIEPDDLSLEYGLYLLNNSEIEHYVTLDNETAQKEYLTRTTGNRALIAYLQAINLCQTLHESENKFSAIDAYHLGLIDEIFGMTHLFPSKRSLASDYTEEE